MEESGRDYSRSSTWPTGKQHDRPTCLPPDSDGDAGVVRGARAEALQYLGSTIGGRKAAVSSPVESGFEWIVHFREEMDRFGHNKFGRGMRIEYPYVVPKQMKALKESAFTPQGHLFLGLNFRSNASQEDKNMTRLKANWANNYIRWRTRQGLLDLTTSDSLGGAEVPHDGWKDFLGGLDIDVDAAVECYELSFHYVPALHREQLKEMLAADALFLGIYLLYLSGDLPVRGFSWLVHDPQFRAASSHYFLLDLFLLENQIPLRVVEALVQDFCKCRVKGDRSEGLARPWSNTDLKALGKLLLKKLVLAAVDRRLKMVFPAPPEPVFDFDIDAAPVVDIGRCEHLLDCLLEAVCSHSRRTKRWEQAFEDTVGASWAQPENQGWSFWKPGYFSSICRVKNPKGGQWYDVTKLCDVSKLMRFVSDTTVGDSSNQKALIQAMMIQSPGPPGGDVLSSSTTSKGLWRPDGITTLEGHLRMADSIMELIGSESSNLAKYYHGTATPAEVIPEFSEASFVRPNPNRQFYQLSRELLVAVSEDVPHADKAQILDSHLVKLKQQLVGALRGVDQDLRPTSGLGNSPSDRVTAYGLTLSYFAETAALLSVLAQVARFKLEGTFLYAITVHFERYGALAEVVLEGLAARGYSVPSPPLRYSGESNETQLEGLEAAEEPSFEDYTMVQVKRAEKVYRDVEKAEEYRRTEVKKAEEYRIAEVEKAEEYRMAIIAEECKAAGQDNSKAESVESATRLKRVGITLGLCDRVQQVDVQMQPATVLRLPRLTIDDGAESLLRNLAVWERIKMADRATPFACFIKLLDNLIDTAEDVALMRDAGVISHHLGSDAAVATMVNDLVVGLSFYSSPEWADMLRQLNVRTKDKKKQYWAEFVDNYFSRPWHATATLAATFLLLLTVAQTIFTAMQVYPDGVICIQRTSTSSFIQSQVQMKAHTWHTGLAKLVSRQL